MGGSEAQVGGIFDPTQSKRGGRGTFKVLHTSKNFIEKWILLSFLSFSSFSLPPLPPSFLFVRAWHISEKNKNVTIKWKFNVETINATKLKHFNIFVMYLRRYHDTWLENTCLHLVPDYEFWRLIRVKQFRWVLLMSLLRWNNCHVCIWYVKCNVIKIRHIKHILAIN